MSHEIIEEQIEVVEVVEPSLPAYKKAPKGWRFLEQGEIVQGADRYSCSCSRTDDLGDYYTVFGDLINNPYSSTFPFIRKDLTKTIKGNKIVSV